MRRLAAGDGPVDVVDDQTGSPTYVADLAVALLQVADDRVPGPILHAANEGAVSRFEQARAVFEGVRRRPGTGAAGQHRPISAAGAAAELLGAGEPGVRGGGAAPLRPWRPALVAALAASDSIAAGDRPLPSTRD